MLVQGSIGMYGAGTGFSLLDAMRRALCVPLSRLCRKWRTEASSGSFEHSVTAAL